MILERAAQSVSIDKYGNKTESKCCLSVCPVGHHCCGRTNDKRCQADNCVAAVQGRPSTLTDRSGPVAGESMQTPSSRATSPRPTADLRPSSVRPSVRPRLTRRERHRDADWPTDILLTVDVRRPSPSGILSQRATASHTRQLAAAARPSWAGLGSLLVCVVKAKRSTGHPFICPTTGRSVVRSLILYVLP